MTDRHRALQQATVQAVLHGPGTTAPELRQAVARADGPEDLRALLAKVRTEAATVTDEDWAPLRAKYSEDELFELVVAGVVGTAERRLDAALAALEGA